MNRPFVAENARERERLHSIVGRLTDEELNLPMGTDWTGPWPWPIWPFGTSGPWS